MNIKITRTKRKSLGFTGIHQYNGTVDTTVNTVNQANIDVVAHLAGEIRDQLIHKMFEDRKRPVGVLRITVSVGANDD